MSRQVFGVVGAGYGDEGKGRSVDALVHALGVATTVVRTNGGAQAGHTVTTPDGRRHVFHHLASGALAGAASHCSRFMVSHPMMLAAELRAVAALGGETRITADPRGYVTTPWDMMVNQAAEVARGEARHGSCGLGFGETVGRCEGTPYALTVGDLTAPDLRARLEAIRAEWLPARLAEMGVDGGDFLALADEPGLLDRFIEECRGLVHHVRQRRDSDLCDAGHLVLEAAQGLMLDQHHRDFPFVTRSNTGVANMLAVAEEAGIGRVEAVYATRCYLTRHGRGPMADERAIGEFFDVVDPTNRPNPWQETLRTGLLDIAVLAATIEADAAHATSGTTLVRHVAISCLDQARGGKVTYLDGGTVATCSASEFGDMLGRRVGAGSVAASWGPTRDGLRWTDAPDALRWSA